jgi:hypothetical protein
MVVGGSGCALVALSYVGVFAGLPVASMVAPAIPQKATHLASGLPLPSLTQKDVAYTNIEFLIPFAMRCADKAISLIQLYESKKLDGVAALFWYNR